MEKLGGKNIRFDPIACALLVGVALFIVGCTTFRGFIQDRICYDPVDEDSVRSTWMQRARMRRDGYITVNNLWGDGRLEKVMARYDLDVEEAEARAKKVRQ